MTAEDPRRRVMVHTYLTTAEKRELVERAARLRLSMSGYLRRLALNIDLPGEAEFAAHRAVRDILKVNADQARLGNALILAIKLLEDAAAPPGLLARIAALEGEIRQTQARLKAIVLKIDEGAAP